MTNARYWMAPTLEYRMMLNFEKEMYAYKDMNKNLRNREHPRMCLRETILDRRCLRLTLLNAVVRLIYHLTPGNTHKPEDLPDELLDRLNGHSSLKPMLMRTNRLGRDGTLVVQKLINELTMFTVGKPMHKVHGPPSIGVLSTGMKLNGLKATGMIAVGAKVTPTHGDHLPQLDVCSLGRKAVVQTSESSESLNLRHHLRQGTLLMTRKSLP